MYEDGAAAKDGRLWAGDQILEVRLSIFVVMCFICSVFVPIKSRSVSESRLGTLRKSSSRRSHEKTTFISEHVNETRAHRRKEFLPFSRCAPD